MEKAVLSPCRHSNGKRDFVIHLGRGRNRVACSPSSIGFETKPRELRYRWIGFALVIGGGGP